MTPELGEPVIVALVDGVDTGELYHLPAPGFAGRPVLLDDLLRAGGCPRSWKTRCGLAGNVFVFGELFRRRHLCKVCMARAGLAPDEFERHELAAVGHG